MKKLLLTVALIFISILSFGQVKNFIDQPYLETTAKVDTLVVPDIIYLDIIIREKDEKNKISVEEMETKMVSKLKLLGIDTKTQLTLTDLASSFKKYFLKRKDILKDKAYTLKVFDAKTAGKVLVELENIGISNVQLSKIEYSKMETLKLNLKSIAIAKAKIQAEYLLKPLNQKIVRAIHITDRYYQNYRKYNDAGLQEIAVAYSPKTNQEYTPPEIEFKSIKVESEITVKFAID